MRTQSVVESPHAADIVVGVDGSEPSTQALIWALGVAASCDWTVEAVTAWPDADAVLVHEVPGHFCAPRQRAIAMQESAIARARRAVGGGPALDGQLVNAHPVEALRDHAAGARLVVVGTHPADSPTAHPGRAPIGESLALLVDCPVVVVRDDGRDVARSTGPGSGSGGLDEPPRQIEGEDR